MALSHKDAAIPKRAIIAPPSAGPIARLILKPTPFAETAGARSSFGTSCGAIRLPGGSAQSTADANEEGEQQQYERRDQKYRRDYGYRHFRHQQESPPVDDIRQRSRRNCHQEYRKRGCNLNQ
jgi:hypothetical protein